MDLIANWLWQGCVLAGAMTVILRLRPQVSATARYRLWWMVMGAVIALPALQWLPAQSSSRTAATTTTGSPYVVQLPFCVVAAVLHSLFRRLDFWSLGYLGYGLRAPAHDQTRVRQRVDRLSGSRCRAGRRCGSGDDARVWSLSDEVRSVGVLGITSPVIAFSPTVARGTDRRRVGSILVHEWAHVQRRDDVARLVQIVVRAIAGLHPAVWWVDRQLHIDRETACDDWAINLTGSSRPLCTMSHESRSARFDATRQCAPAGGALQRPASHGA